MLWDFKLAYFFFYWVFFELSDFENVEAVACGAFRQIAIFAVLQYKWLVRVISLRGH